MTNKYSQRAQLVFLLGSLVLPGASLHAAVLFQVQDYYASGPIALSSGQTANACASNLDASPMPIFIALLAADNGSLLASQHATLQPGMGLCVTYTPSQQANAIQQGSSNVLAEVVPNGRLDASGRIVQISPGGGGCIAASLQIQILTVNNIPAQTILYAPMLEHSYSQADDGD